MINIILTQGFLTRYSENGMEKLLLKAAHSIKARDSVYRHQEVNHLRVLKQQGVRSP